MERQVLDGDLVGSPQVPIIKLRSVLHYAATRFGGLFLFPGASSVQSANKNRPRKGGLAAFAPGGQCVKPSVNTQVEGGAGINLGLARVVPVAFLSCQFGGRSSSDLTKLDIIVHHFKMIV